MSSNATLAAKQLLIKAFLLSVLLIFFKKGKCLLRKIPVFKIKHSDCSSVPWVSCRTYEPALWSFLNQEHYIWDAGGLSSQFQKKKKNPKVALRDRVSCSRGQLLTLLEMSFFVVEDSAR